MRVRNTPPGPSGSAVHFPMLGTLLILAIPAFAIPIIAAPDRPAPPGPHVTRVDPAVVRANSFRSGQPIAGTTLRDTGSNESQT